MNHFYVKFLVCIFITINGYSVSNVCVYSSLFKQDY